MQFVAAFILCSHGVAASLELQYLLCECKIVIRCTYAKVGEYAI